MIDNEFWYTKEAKKFYKDINENYKDYESLNFNDEIYSNNINILLNKIKNDKNKFDNFLPLIDDISITLPTLLEFKNNYIYEDLIINKFEEILKELFLIIKKKMKLIMKFILVN